MEFGYAVAPFPTCWLHEERWLTTVQSVPAAEHEGGIRQEFCGEGEDGLPAAGGWPLLQKGRETHFTSNGGSATEPATALKISSPPKMPLISAPGDPQEKG